MMLKRAIINGRHMVVHNKVFSRKHIFANNMIIMLVFAAPVLILLADFQNRQLVYTLSIWMIGITLWIGCTLRQISPNVFNLYSLFILAAILFNGGQIYLEVFHLNEAGILDGKFDPANLSRTIFLVVLSITSFHVGGLLGARKRNKLSANQNHYSNIVSAQALRVLGYGLLFISIIPIFIATVKALIIVTEGGYFSLYEQRRSTGLAAGTEGIISIFSRLFIPAIIFLYAGSSKKYIARLIITFVFIIYVSILFFMGMRGYGTMLLLSGLWLRHILIKPLPLRQLLVIGVVLLFVVFPTIKHIRNIEGASRYTLKYFKEAYFSVENTGISTISEMGGSMQTIAYTLQLVPERRPFAMGATYAFVATSIMPNFFWDLHPAVKHGSLSRWLTTTVAPWTFSRGGGLGYSFIAEAYANFGWIGAPIMLALIGFVLARLVNWPSGSEDYARIAVVAICIATVLIWVRGDANIVVRPIVYYALLPYQFFLFIRNRLANKVKTKSRVALFKSKEKCAVAGTGRGLQKLSRL